MIINSIDELEFIENAAHSDIFDKDCFLDLQFHELSSSQIGNVYKSLL
jgi:hypothetical protein